MKNQITIETVEELEASQVIIPDWMARVTANLRPLDEVEVERRVTPFGTFCLSVKKATVRRAEELMRAENLTLKELERIRGQLAADESEVEK